MATAAREIGQIFAQQINFRQSLKDRIEDYIMKTELASIDPALQRARQAEVNRLRDGINELDKQISDIIKEKIDGISAISERYIAGTGSILAQQVAAGGRVEASRIAASADLQTAIIRSRTDLEEARVNNQSRERIAEMERNERVLSDLGKAELEGDEGKEPSLKKVIEEAQVFSGTTVDELDTALANLWNKEYKAKFESLDGNPLAQRQLVQNWTEAADTFVGSIGSPQIRQTIQDELVNEAQSAAEKAIASAGLKYDYLQQDRAELLMSQASKLGYQEPKQAPSIRYYASGSGAGVGARPPVGGKITGADRKTLLGLQTDAQVKEFEDQAAYNKYLVDVSDKGGTPISLTEFKRQSTESGSEAAQYIDLMRKTAPVTVAQFGDEGLVRLMLQRRGAATELEDVKNAYAASSSSLPSYQAVQRKTLEAYSELYGGRGQRRLVELAEYGRETPITITDQTTGEEKQVFLDAPELEVLFGGGVKGKAEGGPTEREGGPTNKGSGMYGLDQKFKGRGSGMQRQGSEEITDPYADLPPMPERPPQAEVLVGRPYDLDPEYVRELDEFYDTMEKRPKVYRRKLEKQMGPVEPIDPAKTEELIGEITPAEPITDPDTPLGKEGLKKLLEEFKGVPEAKLEQDLKNTIEKANALREELASADPVRAAQIQDELKALGTRAQAILIASKSNDIKEEDFGNLTQEELVAKIEKKGKPQEVPQTAESLKRNQDFVTFAEGSVTASKVQRELNAGKQASPTKFVKGSDKLSKGQVETIKSLAQKKGSVRQGELTKMLAQILEVDATSPLVEKAKSLYIAFEQLA